MQQTSTNSYYYGISPPPLMTLPSYNTLPYHKSPDFLSRGSNDNFTQGGFFFPIAYRANKIRYVE